MTHFFWLDPYRTFSAPQRFRQPRVIGRATRHCPFLPHPPYQRITSDCAVSMLCCTPAIITSWSGLRLHVSECRHTGRVQGGFWADITMDAHTLHAAAKFWLPDYDRKHFFRRQTVQTPIQRLFHGYPTTQPAGDARNSRETSLGHI